MKYSIEENENNLDISVDDVKDKKEKLLQAFQECQQGRCSCPTEEYKKLESLDIKQSEQGMQLHLKAKDGTILDKAEINRCLEYTTKRVEQDST